MSYSPTITFYYSSMLQDNPQTITKINEKLEHGIFILCWCLTLSSHSSQIHQKRNINPQVPDRKSVV